MVRASVTPAVRTAVQVTASSPVADDVVALTLTDADGDPLPRWTAGAHVDLHLPSGLVRSYSLCGDPAAPTYLLAVQRDPCSRGGSREVHDAGLLGRYLKITGPRNTFALEPAGSLLFVAGGIGITPIVSMVRAAEAAGTPWRLVYAGRRLTAMPFREELSGRAGGTVTLLPEDTDGRPDLDALLREVPAGAGVYCCGPAGMLAAAEQAARRAPGNLALHVERFAPVPPPTVAKGGFEVELRRSGITRQVPPTSTLLQVVRDALPEVDFSCEEGVCGTCETSVLEGRPDHRDSVLSSQERASNTVMMICVGRSLSPRLVLDL